MKKIKNGKNNGRKSCWILHKRVILFLGGKCIKCGNSDLRLLQINHINGGGKKEYLQAGGSRRIYRDILINKRKIDDLEVRCANCQIDYEYEVGRRVEWPLESWNNKKFHSNEKSEKQLRCLTKYHTILYKNGKKQKIYGLSKFCRTKKIDECTLREYSACNKFYKNIKIVLI